MNVAKFIKDRYIQMPDSGIYYDVYPMKRGEGDQMVFNARIDQANNYLQTLGRGYKCTLLLNEGQVADLTDHWRLIFAPKTHLMIFKPGQDVGSYNVEPWASYFNDAFWWASVDKVYTKYDSNNCGDRFRQVEKSEVDDYVADTPPIILPPVVIDPVISSIPKKWKIKFFGGIISGTIEADE